MLNVFHRDGDTIRHFWSSELFYAPSDPGQDPRHVGTLEPLWNLFDLTPEGRPADWDEQLRYGDRRAATSGGDGERRWPSAGLHQRRAVDRRAGHAAVTIGPNPLPERSGVVGAGGAKIFTTSVASGFARLDRRRRGALAGTEGSAGVLVAEKVSLRICVAPARRISSRQRHERGP